MNLCGDSWIPVLLPDGSREKVSLNTLFAQAARIRDLSAEPLHRIALMRLLVCLTQAALDGPANARGWKECPQHIGPAVRSYLEKFRDRFELFSGPSPFLRLPGVEHNRNSLVDKLDFDLSSGNNQTLYDREALAGGRVHPSDRMALLMLAYQCFSPGGLIGTTDWNGIDTSRHSEQAPCSEGSPLHTLIQGSNLLETIHYNLVPKDTLASMGISFGRPIWEDYPNSADEAGPGLTCSYLGRLVPVSRLIVIEKNNPACTLAAGIAYPKIPAYRDPHLTVWIKKDKAGKTVPLYLRCSPGRHSWRDLGSILSLAQALDGAGGSAALQNLSSLGKSVRFSVWTGGLALDQAKILDVLEWSCALRREMLGEGSLGKYRKGIQDADTWEWRLKRAIEQYCAHFKDASGSSGKFLMAKILYWAHLDRNYENLIECASSIEMTMGSWRAVIRDAADDAYCRVCARQTPRQIQAFEAGRDALRRPARKSPATGNDKENV